MNDNTKLKNYLDSVPKGKYSETRKKIARKCYVNDSTISHWVTGRNKVPPLAQKEINKIAKQKIFEI